MKRTESLVPLIVADMIFAPASVPKVRLELDLPVEVVVLELLERVPPPETMVQFTVAPLTKFP